MKKTWLAYLLCLAAVFTFPWGASAGQTLDIFRPFEKGVAYETDDAILKGIESNVLLYVETTANMVISMKGQLPIFQYVNNIRTNPDDAWMRTNYPMMRDADFRAGLLKENTFSIGARPISEGTAANQTARLEQRGDGVNRMTLGAPLYPGGLHTFISPHLGTERSNESSSAVTEWPRWLRYGRDTDEANNIIGHPDSYYTPDERKPYLLTFRNSTWANWVIGTPVPSDLVLTLGQYLPIRDANGVITSYGDAVPFDLANEHLVPNDSKMYKMKLVLWRILSPTKENVQLLSNLRLGLATTFSDRTYPHTGTVSAAMAYAPFRYDSATKTTGYGGAGTGSVATGDRDLFEAYHGNSDGTGALGRK